MRKINETFIDSSRQMFFKQGTWTHLQKAYIEPIAETIKTMIGSGYDPAKVYVLNGCVNSGSGSTYIISEGSVFYNGEIFLVDATTFTVTTGTAICTIVTTPNTTDYSADPCLFTNGSTENVHDIRKVVISEGVSGSGIKNYANIVFYPFKNNYKKYDNLASSSALTITSQKELVYESGEIDVYVYATYPSTISAGTYVLTVNDPPNNNTNADIVSAGVVTAYLTNGSAVSTTTLYYINGLGSRVYSAMSAISNTYDTIIIKDFYKF